MSDHLVWHDLTFSLHIYNRGTLNYSIQAFSVTSSMKLNLMHLWAPNQRAVVTWTFQRTEHNNCTIVDGHYNSCQFNLLRQLQTNGNNYKQSTNPGCYGCHKSAKFAQTWYMNNYVKLFQTPTRGFTKLKSLFIYRCFDGSMSHSSIIIFVWNNF